MTTEQEKNSLRLYELADEALVERSRWAGSIVRRELLWVHVQLEYAADEALNECEDWGDAWAEAGVLTINRYKAARILIDNITGAHDETPSRTRPHLERVGRARP